MMTSKHPLTTKEGVVKEKKSSDHIMEGGRKHSIMTSKQPLTTTEGLKENVLLRKNSTISLHSSIQSPSKKGTVPPGTLSQEVIEGCRLAFQHLDHNRTGKIDAWELKSLLEVMGMKPSEAELFSMMSEVDVNMSGHVDFSQLLKIVKRQKERLDTKDDGSDLAAAFVACGGDSDKGGCVDANLLIKLIKEDFGLSVDMEALIREVDTDGSGKMEFRKFQELLS